MGHSETTVSEVVDYFLDCISSKNDEINAFVEVYTKSAKEKAIEVDQKLKEGKAGKLAGLIISIKDNICYKGRGLSASSKMLEKFESLYSATVVERLL